ncbi:uncharacterized protein F4807DRAFT_460061 [Annulohypoxylon truncatum]|uniref:uncharacterized protein n=1 Tax=Annulohypoxylon truncatum TaxID=327061 RepID=UPI0020076FB4|nr:uncharacterized protein F4807DRAFT_460061 [Annulohypoxylon truncatum]KAI1210230.1 hypothetical protein F4807DRAFT_460061 [Annulohypoxylon truncatum]
MEGKMEAFIELSQVFDYVFTRDTLEVQMWWILKRYKLFKRMSLARQSQYLTQLIEWRNNIGKHDGLYLAYFLPGVHIFDHVTSEDQSSANTGKNWFVWWYSSRRYGLLRVDCNKIQRILDEDRMLLDKLRPREIEAQILP